MRSGFKFPPPPISPSPLRFCPGARLKRALCFSSSPLRFSSGLGLMDYLKKLWFLQEGLQDRQIAEWQNKKYG
jgi:hypothetical protein